MKNILKYLFTCLLISLIFPIVSNAATFSLKENQKNDGVVVYDIVYTPGDAPLTTTVKVDLTKTNNDLTYKVKKNENGGAVGTCNEFPCTLGLDLVDSETVIASLTITNTSTEEKTSIIKLSGDITSDEVTVKVKPINNTTTTTTQRALSTDTGLSNLTLSVGVLDQEFNKDVVSYNVTGIKDTVNRVTITPNCDNNCSWTVTCPLGECSVSNSRIVSLQAGANKVSVTVTSEDGNNNKSYVLNIYRGEIETSSAYLSDLKITEGELSPSFDSLTNDYTITVGLDVEKLDIITTPEDPKADIKIKGNENLVEGENTITVTVTSSDGENKQVYTIIVNKEEVEEVDSVEKNDINTTVVEKKEKNNIWLIIVLVVLSVGAITTTAILLFRKNKKKKNNKNNKNNKNGGSKIEEPKIKEESEIEKQNTESLNILNETRRQMHEEPKQDIDEALDDLMQTKRLELGDLGL